MSIPSDPSSKLQAESYRVDFLKGELALCFMFSLIATARSDAGDWESAERSSSNAETAYSTALRFLSDTKHSKHLTGEEIQDIAAELEQLRERLDGLQRFREAK